MRAADRTSPVRQIAIVLTLGFCAAVGLGLLRHVPDVVERSLAPPDSDAPARPIRVPSSMARDGVIVREITFDVADAPAFAQDQEIRLTLGTYDSTPSVSSGRMQIDGTRCIFDTKPGRISNNAPRPFIRTAPCSDIPPGPGRVHLTLALAADVPRLAQLAVWAVPAPDQGSTAMELEADGVRLTPVGSRIRQRSTAAVRRIALLAKMWERPVWHLWGVLCIAGVLLVAGATIVSSQRPALIGSALSTGAIAAGLAIAYAVIVPPLQAPDEPDHLLSFAKLNARPELAVSAEEWARQIHFDRIAFGPNERFRPVDGEQPATRAWNPGDVFAEDVARRASTTSIYWRAASGLLPSRASTVLFSLRIVNALIFGSAFTVAVVLIGRGGALASTPHVALLPLLAIPTLPFFGMQLSELTWAIAGFLLLGAVWLAFTTGGATAAAGAALGAAAAVFVSGPRSTWPMAGLLAAVLVGRLLLAPAQRWQESLRFWAAVVAPAILLFATGVFTVPTPFYEQWHFEQVSAPGGLSNRAVVLATALLFAVGYLTERGRVAAGRKLGSPAWPQRMAQGLVLLGAAAVIATALASLFIRMPHLQTLEQVPATARDYVTSVLVNVLTAGRLTQPDLLTWTSFVGAFGWIDTLLPTPVIIVLTTLWVAAAAWLLLRAGFRAEGIAAGWLLLLGAGVVLSIVAYATASYGMNRNVHGRYLLGPYIVTMAVLGATPALHAGRGRQAGYTLPLLTGIVSVHAFSLSVLLERYFG